MLTHVDYLCGRMHDMNYVTRWVHAAGSVKLWDLAHTGGE